MLKRVSIQNFKSLKDVTLDLQKVNLLIGPNNSGKSNFLKALVTISESGSTNNQPVVSEEFHFKKDSSQHVQIVLATHDYRHANTLYYQYTFLKWHSIRRKESYKLYHTIYKYFVEDISEIDKFEEIDSDTFARYYSYLRIYKPDPNKLIEPLPVDSKFDFLLPDASNLVTFFDNIFDEHRGTILKKIEDDLSICIPEFKEVILQKVAPSEKLAKIYGTGTFKRLGLTNTVTGVKYWADELSEGTLYFLALICIINQPNPPKLLLLEEPEKGIHPRRIWEVMKFIFQLAEEKDIQIILTTHNEHVVNAFSSTPEAVFVFDKDEEGATHVRNLQRDIIDVSNKKSEENGFDPIDFTSDLGKSWLYGLIGGVPEENI